MSDFLLFICLSLSFRWFVFEFRHTGEIRERLKIIWGDELGNELLSCPYCQSVESGLVVMIFCYFGGLTFSPYLIPFVLLACGMAGMITAPFVDLLIDLLVLEQEE